jgi:hypothetical protein
MRSEDELRAMIRRLSEEAEAAHRELRSVLDRPWQAGSSAVDPREAELDALLRRWTATIRAIDALKWEAGDLTNDGLLTLVRMRPENQQG